MNIECVISSIECIFSLYSNKEAKVLCVVRQLID